jgi:hypothetical protein
MRSGDGWEMYVDGEVLVAEFTDWRVFEDPETVRTAFEELVRQPAVTAHVVHMDFDRIPGDRMLKAATLAAESGVDHGLERWAAVADGIERLTVKSRVDVAGLDVLATDDVTEAMRWARA